MAYVALCKALYDYVAQAEDELNFAEDDYVYILESDDPEWWKAKLRRLNEDGTPVDDEQDVVGLVPANYVEEAEPLRLSRALYDYEAQNEDELSMAEDELLRVYESDGLWLLVKKQGNDPLSGGEGRLGYVPANYVDEAEAVDTGAAPVTEGQYGNTEEDEEEEDEADESTTNPAAIPQISLPQTANIGKGDEIKMWPVSALDAKKKKKKGTLGIGNASLFFASESDKTPVQKISVLHISNHTLEKGKTIHIDLSSESGLSESSLSFQASSKDAGSEIIKKIEASKANALTASAAAAESAPSTPAATASAPRMMPPASLSTATPPAPPGPTSAATSTLPPPTRSSAAMLPPPVRKSVSFQSQGEPTATQAEPETADAEEHAVALYDFEAQGDDELSVAENEHLVILEKENDDWWKVRNDSGHEGVVPASYVEISHDAAAGGSGVNGSGAAASAAAAAAAEEQRLREEEEEAAVAEAERQREAAESTERRRREAEERREREVQERARRDALKAQPAPAPPKLTQRPSTTEVTRAAKNVAIPQGRSAPERPKDGGGRSKPSPNNTRLWTDRTGQFKVEAEFLGFNQGKIRLHKMNGVVIEVAVEKMSNTDIEFLEDITGKKLNPTDQEIAASASRRSSRAHTQAASTSQASREDKERERERRKEKEREQRRREQARSGPKRNVDWFEFFLAAGVDVDECTRYASAFERDKIDETVLGDLDSGTLRSMGLREGDIIRVSKFIDRKYRRDKTAPSSRQQSGKANANTAADLERQIKADEEMARKLQEQETAARRGDSVSPAPPQLFSGPDGTLKNNTRRGRPTPKTTSGSNVDAASLAAASESLARSSTASPPARANTVSPTAVPKRTGSSLANGFDDDAWTPRPPSTKPATPARPSISSPAPPAPTPPPAPAAAAAPSVTSASPAPAASTSDPNSALFDKLAAMKPPSSGASPRPGASPSPASSFLGQNQAYNPNAPRGPFAPVPANQGLLQPLVPTQGTGQFVPTKMQPQATGMMGMQMTGMQPQQTGWGMQQGMQPQMTGYNNGMNGMNGFGGAGQMTGMGMGMQPQATGFGGGMGSGFVGGGSPFGGQMNPQQTGFPGMQQPQQTGFTNFGQTPSQLAAQQTGFGVGSQQQQQEDDKDKFNATNIFQQMKTGQFAKDPNAAPQNSNKYDALRPQPTGFQPGGVMPQYTGMNFGQQQQGGYGGYGGYQG